MDWLKCKDFQSRTAMMKSLGRDAGVIKRKFKGRQLAIEEAQRTAVAERMRKREEATKAKLLEKEAFTTNILHHGLWQSHTEIDNMLPSYDSIATKKSALKAQLQFRRDVLLQQGSSKSLFSLSKMADTKRRQLTVEELTSNLKQLVHQAEVVDGADGSKHMLVGKRVSHMQVVEVDGKKERKAFKGRIISQVINSWCLIYFNTLDSCKIGGG